MNYELYDYQEKVYQEILDKIKSGVRSIVAVMPTRSGKSGVIAKLIELFGKDKPVYFVAHTKILIDQMSQECTFHGLRHGIIAPYSPELRYRVQVISKDTLFNRFKRMKDSGWLEPAIILVDECHLSMSDRYKEILDSYPNSIIIGVTATLIRLDGKPFYDIFQDVVIGPTIQELQKRNPPTLCKVKTLVVNSFDDSGLKIVNGDYREKDLNEKVNKSFIIKDIVEHWKEHALNKKTISFCVSISHAEDMAEEFNKQGFPSIALSSKNSKEEIAEALKDFYARKYINLCSVSLFIMGFTVKDCECVIQGRPTQSLMVYMQSVGRGMMPSPGKPYLINLDCVNNLERHGRIELDREWSLSGPGKKETSEFKRCPECQEPIPKGEMICPACGYIYEQTETVRNAGPEEVDGEMVEIEDIEIIDEQVIIRAVARRARSVDQARDIAAEHGKEPDFGEEVWIKILKMAV